MPATVAEPEAERAEPAVGRVLVLGSLNVDHVVRVDRHPSPGETIRGSDVAKLWGGKGANQAAAAAGAAVVFVGRVGDDADGQAYRRRMADRSIESEAVTQTPGVATGQAMIAVDLKAENTIIVSPGANAHVSEDDLEPLRQITAADVLLVGLEIDAQVVAAGVRLAAGAGARVVLNLAPFAPLPAHVLELANPVVVNEHEAQLLARTGADPKSLLVTLGLRGSRWGEIVIPAAPVAGSVDTTGAGDTYCVSLDDLAGSPASLRHALRGHHCPDHLARDDRGRGAMMTNDTVAGDRRLRSSCPQPPAWTGAALKVALICLGQVHTDPEHQREALQRSRSAAPGRPVRAAGAIGSGDATVFGNALRQPRTPAARAATSARARAALNDQLDLRQCQPPPAARPIPLRGRP